MRLLSNLRRTAVVLPMIMMILLSGCGGQKVIYTSMLIPQTVTAEKAQNALGARFTFTLDEYTERFNKTLRAFDPGEEEPLLDQDRWSILSDRSVDDSGVGYSSYFYPSDTVTFTAAAENDSGRVLNVGCGCPKAVMQDSENPYHDKVMLLMALMTITAGGYHIEDADRIIGIIEAHAAGEETDRTVGVTLSVEYYDDTAVCLLSASADIDA